jgi:phage shock protein A
MNTVKRLFISIKQQIENLAEDFEDHQALINAAIVELDEVGATTQIQLNRTRNELTNYEKQIKEIETESTLWADRARKLHTEDESKALDCVKRIKALQSQSQRLAEQIDHSIEVERHLIKDLNAINDKRNELKIRKDNLSSRQNRTVADQLMAHSENGVVTQADRILDRWENRVVSKEYRAQQTQHAEHLDTVDPLQHQFEQEEEMENLKSMLDQLTNPADQPGKSEKPDQ